MKASFSALKSILIGGIVFLLPIGVVAVVLGKLLQLARHVSDQIHDALFPTYQGNFVPLLIAILTLVCIAFLAGAIARTNAGRRVFLWLETAVLSNLPVYPVVKQTLDDMAGGSARLSETGGKKVVRVRLDDMTVLGFLIERRDDDTCVVFLPGAPSALSGSVALIDEERVTLTDLSLAQVVQGMRRLGAGLALAEAAARRADGAGSP